MTLKWKRKKIKLRFFCSTRSHIIIIDSFFTLFSNLVYFLHIYVYIYISTVKSRYSFAMPDNKKREEKGEEKKEEKKGQLCFSQFHSKTRNSTGG